MTTIPDDEKHANFLRIKEHIYLLNTTRLTEDRVEDYKAHLRILRDNFADFTVVNPEIRDYRFRGGAVEAEILLSHLLHDIRTHGSFNANDYLRLMETILKMADFIVDDDELVGLMGTMRFQ